MNTYSEEEVTEIVNNLVLEKKRSQELERELERRSSQQDDEPSSLEQTKKFKQLITILRKKYEESQLKNNEAQKTIEKLLVEKDQLKSNITEAELAQLIKAKEIAEQSFRENEEELAALRGQLIKLKELVGNDLKEELKSSQQKQAQLERVIRFLRGRGEEAQLENNAIAKELMRTQQENKELRSELEKAQLNEVHEKLLQEKEALLAEALKDKQAIATLHSQQQSQIEEWKKCLADNVKEIEALKHAFVKKQEELEKTKSELEQIPDLKAKLTAMTAERDEILTQLKTAQQHLAKKVRETTLISEKYEGLKNEHLELQKNCDSAKVKAIELQANLESQSHHQAQLHFQHQESLKAFEAQTCKWEEKFFDMQARWQDSENLIREFKAQEERYAKLEQLLNSIVNLKETSLSTTQSYD